MHLGSLRTQWVQWLKERSTGLSGWKCEGSVRSFQKWYPWNDERKTEEEFCHCKTLWRCFSLFVPLTRETRPFLCATLDITHLHLSEVFEIIRNLIWTRSGGVLIRLKAGVKRGGYTVETPGCLTRLFQANILNDNLNANLLLSVQFF